jgi:aliphatic aldoxime dehydratase
MESAIPKHLTCPRSRERRIDDDFVPPFPAWVARADASVKDVVMGYFGVQSKGPDAFAKARAALQHIVGGFSLADGPGRHDLAHYVDEAGYDNLIAIAYWDNQPSFAHWQASPAIDWWWSDEARLGDGLGYFREILSPGTERFETLFSTADRKEGVGALMGETSAEIQEHGYWGSMRDRLPIAQIDSIEPSGALSVRGLAPGPGRRTKINGHQNLAVIRSGQEWTETEGKERDLYLGEMEPTLCAGMNFLRDEGQSIGCYANRYMRHIDASGQLLEKSFGLSYWHSLADMERWSESHPTHLAIFGTFMRIVQELNFQLKLRLYHEVTVLDSSQQDFEYVNCHPETGLMRGV